MIAGGRRVVRSDMYTEFYRLKRGPFEAHPPSRFLYFGDTHREALALLVYALGQGKPLVLLTGEAGTGKTTLLSFLGRMVRKRGERWQSSLLVNPRVDFTDFYQLIFHDLGVADRGVTKADFLIAFDHYLEVQSSKPCRVLLFIDEAQELSDELLREIRYMLNAAAKYPNTLQILLAGQPALEARLMADGLRNLNQRVSLWCRLKPLDDEQTKEYVSRRLGAAGCPAERQLIDDAALTQVCNLSSGIPANVNMICDNSLMLGSLKQLRTVDESTVREAAAEAGFTGAASSQAPAPNAARKRNEPWLRRVFR